RVFYIPTTHTFTSAPHNYTFPWTSPFWWYNVTETAHFMRRIIMSTTDKTRIERDSMGEMQVPAHAYYGASRHRAILNFPICDLRFPRRFIRALGQIKQAAAEVNESLGTVDPQIAKVIVLAAQ